MAQNQNEIEIMKKLLLIALVSIISIIFFSLGFAQAKAAPGKTTQEKVARKEAPASKKGAAKPKAEAPGFVGKVAMINATMIAVKGKKAEVTFDTRNPKLEGYKAIGDVMVGDTVAAEYTKDGIMITKVAGAKAEEPEKEKPKTEMKEKPKAAKHEAPKRKEPRPASAAEKKAERPQKEPTEQVVRRISCTGTKPCKVSVVKLTEAGDVFVRDYELKVINKSKQGGSGTVTSAPMGIFCSTGGSIGCKDFFPYGEDVTLSASADTGSTFTGWRPASNCPGTGYCIVPMDKERSVRAAFTFSGQ
jgi:hypothetical protein